MRVLGIHDGHNASACLVESGRIRMAVQEERLRREKNFAGFPSQAVDLMLLECGLQLDDLDVVAVVGRDMPDHFTREERLDFYRDAGRPGYLARRRREEAIRRVARAVVPQSLRDAVRGRARRDAVAAAAGGRLGRFVDFGIPCEKLRIVEHHQTHAASAYHGLGDYENDILILTNDGEGDGVCATVSVGRAGRIERLSSVPRSESVGNVFAVVTFLMGMVPLEHEYKLMGMAPYADERRASQVAAKFARLFTFEGASPLGWRRQDGCPDPFYSYRLLRELLEYERFDSVCAGLQRFLEEFLVQWVRNCIAQTGIRRLALSGGVFMNVKLNKAIMELPEVASLFVFPSCADETTSIGAAWQVASQSGERIEPLGPFYLGRAYDDSEVQSAIDAFDFSSPISVERCESIEQRVVELLAAGQIVARFKGREEFGARALGNRSILADPSNTELIKVINSMIKCRDFWMPFATSMTDRQANECLVNPKAVAAPYMILTFETTERVSEFRAGAHPYDLTVRPQVVYRDWNPSYYELIEHFERLSGKRGGVLNTSFNLHGHPLVSSPRNALDVFARSGLRHLAIESFLVSKRT